MSPRNAHRQPTVFRVVQITDTHLFADPSKTLLGMNCEQGLRDVLAEVTRTDDAIAALLMTGDASQDGSERSYQRLYELLQAVGARQYWIPGNHDESRVMAQALGATNGCFERTGVVGNWQVVLLASNVAEAVHGFLSPAELERLDTALRNSRAEHVLVCLHHNPVPVAATWLQRHALQNPQDLFAVLDRHPRVKLVLFGHIHHELRAVRGAVTYLGAPSTCVQFHPRHADFALDRRNPGFRWVDLHADGTFVTGVRRVRHKHYSVDFSGTGY